MNKQITYKCEKCGRLFSRKESLTRHINYTHLKIKKLNSKHICLICKKEISKKMLYNHLKNEHKYTDFEIFEYRFLNSRQDFDKIDKDILKEYLRIIYEVNHGKLLYIKQFNSYCRMIKIIRGIRIDDVKNFFDNVLPWKLKNKKICNSRELCNLTFKNEPENAKKLYKISMFDNNPFTNHGGIYSPFSSKFVGYEGMSEDEIKDMVYNAGKYDKIGRTQNQAEYWIAKGYSDEEAKIKVHERQQTFSLKKCIEKYGEKEGYKRWKERQEKWLKSLNSKTEDEIKRINHDKVYKNGATSGIESEFLHSIIEDESFHNVYLKDLKATVDLLYENKIVEFYGDYWHCNPLLERFTPDFCHPYLKMTAKEKWEFDDNRRRRLENSGYSVMIIWEKDYNENKKETVEKCKKFLGVK